MHPLDFEEVVAGAVVDIDAGAWNAAVDATFARGNALLVEEESLEDDEDVTPRSDFGVVALNDRVGLIILVSPHFGSVVDGETFNDADLAEEGECRLAHRLALLPTHDHDVGSWNGLHDLVEVVKSRRASDGDGGVAGEHVFGVVANDGDVDGETRLLAVAAEMLGDDGGMVDGDEADNGVDDGGHVGDDDDAG